MPSPPENLKQVFHRSNNLVLHIIDLGHVSEMGLDRKLQWASPYMGARLGLAVNAQLETATCMQMKVNLPQNVALIFGGV